MVIRVFILFILSLILQGCPRGIHLPEGTWRPKNYKEMDYEKYIVSEKKIDFSKLDTNAIYVAVARKYGSQKTTYESFDTTQFKAIYRFYGNGKCSSFTITDTLISKQGLNPKKGIMGFYKPGKNKDEVITSLYVSTPSGHVFRKWQVEIKNDTLFSNQHPNTTNDHRIYVKRQVPKDWLDWQPDW